MSDKISYVDMQDMVDEVIELAIETLFSKQNQSKHGWTKEDWEEMVSKVSLFEEDEESEFSASYH